MSRIILAQQVLRTHRVVEAILISQPSCTSRSQHTLALVVSIAATFILTLRAKIRGMWGQSLDVRSMWSSFKVCKAVVTWTNRHRYMQSVITSDHSVFLCGWYHRCRLVLAEASWTGTGRRLDDRGQIELHTRDLCLHWKWHMKIIPSRFGT